MTPEDVELLFRSRNRSDGTNSTTGEDDDLISDTEKAIRVQQLKQVLLAAHDAWESGSGDLDLIAEKLADGSRDGRFTTSWDTGAYYANS